MVNSPLGLSVGLEVVNSPLGLSVEVVNSPLGLSVVSGGGQFSIRFEWGAWRWSILH